jgi:hypothetical protein
LNADMGSVVNQELQMSKNTSKANSNTKRRPGCQCGETCLCGAGCGCGTV